LVGFQAKKEHCDEIVMITKYIFPWHKGLC
jgi:hypothetical protein